MRTRRLGRRGPVVSELGLGCMGMSMAYGTPDEDESRATLEAALDLGINFFDTADIYGPFTNEELVGRALRGRREEVVLATKCGFVPGGGGGRSTVDGSPEHIRAACEASLRRLGISTIDLYYLHRVDPTTPIERSVGAMAELVEDGLVRYLGLSEVSGATLRRAHAVHPITAVQSEFSLWTREPESKILPTCRELGVGFVPFSPLGRGFLSGTIRSAERFPEGDLRRSNPRFRAENLARNLVLVDRLRNLATAKGCSAAQLALAWVLAQGDDIVPIPGTKRRSYLSENAAAADVVLTAADLAEITAALPATEVAGPRYAPESEAWVDR